MFNYWSLGPQNLTVMLGLQVMGALIRCRQTFELNSMVVIAACGSVQIVYNWQESDLLACDRLATEGRAFSKNF